MGATRMATLVAMELLHGHPRGRPGGWRLCAGPRAQQRQLAHDSLGSRGGDAWPCCLHGPSVPVGCALCMAVPVGCTLCMGMAKNPAGHDSLGTRLSNSLSLWMSTTLEAGGASAARQAAHTHTHTGFRGRV